MAESRPLPPGRRSGRPLVRAPSASVLYGSNSHLPQVTLLPNVDKAQSAPLATHDVAVEAPMERHVDTVQPQEVKPTVEATKEEEGITAPVSIEITTAAVTASPPSNIPDTKVDLTPTTLSVDLECKQRNWNESNAPVMHPVPTEASVTSAPLAVDDVAVIPHHPFQMLLPVECVPDIPEEVECLFDEAAVEMQKTILKVVKKVLQKDKVKLDDFKINAKLFGNNFMEPHEYLDYLVKDFGAIRALQLVPCLLRIQPDHLKRNSLLLAARNYCLRHRAALEKQVEAVNSHVSKPSVVNTPLQQDAERRQIPVIDPASNDTEELKTLNTQANGQQAVSPRCVNEIHTVAAEKSSARAREDAADHSDLNETPAVMDTPQHEDAALKLADAVKVNPDVCHDQVLSDPRPPLAEISETKYHDLVSDLQYPVDNCQANDRIKLFGESPDFQAKKVLTDSVSTSDPEPALDQESLGSSLFEQVPAAPMDASVVSHPPATTPEPLPASTNDETPVNQESVGTSLFGKALTAAMDSAVRSTPPTYAPEPLSATTNDGSHVHRAHLFGFATVPAESDSDSNASDFSD